MASSSTKALRLASLPGPPPTPTSLLDLPQPWLLKLATCKGLYGQRATLLALFRTCTFFRDAVARHRTAIASFNVPIAAEDFPAEVEWLCAVARRSSRVRLQVYGQEDEEGSGPAHRWTETEPHITHLLVCAMAQLEGEQPLACVKEIAMDDLEQSAVVPPWVKVLCPNATKLDLRWNTFAAQPLHQPRPHPHLQHLEWRRRDDFAGVSLEHMRQQLAALPSLTSLTLRDMCWEGVARAQEEEEDEQQAGRLLSSTVTRLELTTEEELQDRLPLLQRLPTQFPNLRELDAHDCITVDDDGLEALLRLPHLEQLHVWGFSLQHSHAHKALAWAEVKVREVDVDSFARLPLDDIRQACSGWRRLEVQPSADAAAVARVAQAIRRWGGLHDAPHGLTISGEDVAALLTTLGPLVAALPAEQQRQVIISRMRGATPQQVQQLGQHLPASVTTLTLSYCTLAPDAWPVLLPSLPASVVELRLEYTHPDRTEQLVVALCQAAERPIRVVVDRHAGLSEQDRERIRASLVGPDGQPGPVTLVGS